MPGGGGGGGCSLQIIILVTIISLHSFPSFSFFKPLLHGISSAAHMRAYNSFIFRAVLSISVCDIGDDFFSYLVERVTLEILF